MMVLIPLYHRKPRLHRALPVSVASALWRCGTKGKFITCAFVVGFALQIIKDMPTATTQDIAGQFTSSSTTRDIAAPSTSSSTTQDIAGPSTSSSTTRDIATPSTASSITRDIAGPSTSSSITRDIAGPSTSSSTTQDIAAPSTSSNPCLSAVAEEVVRQIWHQIPMNRVADVVNATAEGRDDQLCFCKEDETEWYCTPECGRSDNGLYCVCRRKNGSLTWQCGNQECERGLKFLHRCVRSTLPLTQANWYCSEECSKVAGENKITDGLLEYFKRCTWQCLYSESIRDAEREADGVALMRYWRISMPEFYRRGHNKYVAVGHRMLSDHQLTCKAWMSSSQIITSPAKL
ncbi:uncharacterized protein LOC121422112 isoform X2 [Lytechinus variegatus]|uniref:uncharacterized protein LOC121422112 isoform X2 n=1 Tax=Lytechinus variegatus TaxID=7654 RepID=UPI001BB0E767|nr:uncharacterized protein LOC121422112 isoform X2 [Lytechinus variegatus]